MQHNPANLTASVRLLLLEKDTTGSTEWDELVQHLLSLYPDIKNKHPHSDWCELVTGLWHDCDCGASQERENAMDQAKYEWLVQRGKYVELIKCKP